MGYTIKIECQECDYQQKFFVGEGFRYDPKYIFYGDKPRLSNFIKDKEEQKLISKFMEYTNVQIGGSEERIYRCSKCNQLCDRYYYFIKFDGGKYTPNYKCTNCDYPLEMLKDIKEGQKIFLCAEGKKAEINCPQCGGSKIICVDGGFDWD